MDNQEKAEDHNADAKNHRFGNNRADEREVGRGSTTGCHVVCRDTSTFKGCIQWSQSKYSGIPCK